MVCTVHTLAINGLKGKPPSRANDQSWREDVAISLITADVKTMTGKSVFVTCYPSKENSLIIEVIALVAA